LFLPGEVVGREGGKVHFRVGRGNMIIALNEGDVVSIAEGGVEVRDEAVAGNPWLQLAGLIKDRDYFMARRVQNGYELVMPVAEFGDGTFLGYRAVAGRDGEVLEVLDAGKYRRFSVPGLERFRDILPVEKVSDVAGLSAGEFAALVDNTPAELIPKIGAFDAALAAAIVAGKRARDPQSLEQLDREEVEKWLEVARKYWNLASLENHPAVLAAILTQLRTKARVAPTATPELLYIEGRLLEELKEDEQLEKMKEAARLQREDPARKAWEEAAAARIRQVLDELREQLAKAGIKLPIVVPLAGAVAGHTVAVEEAAGAAAGAKKTQKVAAGQ